MPKFALLVGISEYGAGLSSLPAAPKDVAALEQVLLNPNIGGFDRENVKTLLNPDKSALEQAIYDLFADRQKDDLLLFYFSGHGITSDSEFYFSTCNTAKDSDGRLKPLTAIGLPGFTAG